MDAPRSAGLQERFETVAVLGSGSMGAVYKAWDRKSGLFVALKLVRDETLRERFQREARILFHLKHPSIVECIDWGVTEDGEPWLAMEWLEGTDLDKRLAAGPLSVGDALLVGSAVAEGLACAHDRGLVHRDIKPQNLFLPGGDVRRLKILDFGIARVAGQGEELTATGMLMGTLDYMPAEQISDAKRADARADVYALGAVMFHCLAGKPPFYGKTPADTMMSILKVGAPPVLDFRRDAPPELARLIAYMLERDRNNRPADGAAVVSAPARLHQHVVDSANPVSAATRPTPAPSYHGGDTLLLPGSGASANRADATPPVASETRASRIPAVSEATKLAVGNPPPIGSGGS